MLENSGMFTQGDIQPQITQQGPKDGKTDNSALSIDQMGTELEDEIGADLEHYLGWLPNDLLPTHPVIHQGIQNSASDTRPAYERAPLDQGCRGTKRPFDVMFDWFAWDAYYADNK
jgi:hypothetical protein